MQSILHLAAKAKNGASVVKFFLDLGCDPNAEDWEGRQPLHCACMAGSDESLEELLKAGVFFF